MIYPLAVIAAFGLILHVLNNVVSARQKRCGIRVAYRAAKYTRPYTQVLVQADELAQ
ncbi:MULTISPECIES: hypothetical protein [Stutzerimonas]|jgi:hypothetical protein|uniref:hypothetical protein n=1 Tax=Stutzerimonas TaxID=2901164 RepID=UPI001300C35C|nr:MULTISPECIES: hypothetical protein [Stutzerimonas]